MKFWDSLAEKGKYATIIGFVTLLFSSTIVFYSIQHSLNRLFHPFADKVKTL